MGRQCGNVIRCGETVGRRSQQHSDLEAWELRGVTVEYNFVAIVGPCPGRVPSSYRGDRGFGDNPA